MVTKSLYNPKPSVKFFYNDANGKKCELKKADGTPYSLEEAKDLLRKLGVRKKPTPMVRLR